MTINQTELCKLTGGINVFFVDRAKLPHESYFKYAEGGTEINFTEDQTDARVRSVLSLPGLANAWKEPMDQKHASLKNDLNRASAWVFSSSQRGACSQETLEFGKQIFGWWFDTYPKANLRTQFAIIAPDSPYLDNSIYIESGLRITQRHSNPDLDIRHEIGHLRYDSYSPHMGESLLYFNEARADGFMAYTHLNTDHDIAADKLQSIDAITSLRDGDREVEVQEWIHKRRMEAFFNLSPSEYWTAAAIEATLQKDKIPDWEDNFHTIRGLQIRVLDTLLAEEEGQKNTKTYSTNECRNLSDYKGLLNREAFCVSNEYIPELREKFPPKKIMEMLSWVLKTHDLAEATCREGVKTIEAYNYFCPERAVLSTPTIWAGANKISTLTATAC